jgi:hypothetical protein
MRAVITGVVCLLGLLGVTACGGGASKTSTTSTSARTSAASAERTRLQSELRSTLESPTSPLAGARDLDECLVQQAGRLPLSTLREVASSDANVGRQAAPLVARCMTQGKGVAWFRRELASQVTGKLPPPIPAVYSTCVVAGVNQLSPRQLAAAVSRATTGSDAYAQQLGRKIGFACVQKPAVFAQFRTLWLNGIRKSLQGHHLPAAFVQCVLGKAAQIRPSQLVALVQAGTGAETTYGEKLGRECRSSLVTS